MEQNLDLTKSSLKRTQYTSTNAKIYLDITNKCKHVIKDECQTDQQGKTLCVH